MCTSRKVKHMHETMDNSASWGRQGTNICEKILVGSRKRLINLVCWNDGAAMELRWKDR